MGFDKLEKNLIDIVKEQQAKLGYQKEYVRLYYPLSSLNHFFGSSDTKEEMQERLNNLPDSMTEKLGQLKITHKGDRFCFRIPEEGSEYVHEITKENEFIHSLILVVGNHGCTREQIMQVFEAYSDRILVGEMKDDEFDFWVRFEDDPEDEYYYCFKDEGCHITYHRFLPEDHRDFGFL